MIRTRTLDKQIRRNNMASKKSSTKAKSDADKKKAEALKKKQDAEAKAKAEAEAKEKAAAEEKASAEANDVKEPEQEKPAEKPKAEKPAKEDKTKHKSLQNFTYRNIGTKKEVLIHSRHTLTDGIRRFKPTIVPRGRKEKKLKPIWIPEKLAISLGTKYIHPAKPEELKKKDDEE